ncbi:MAG: hypothetical protein M0C28_20670 [Candidatus Moduliflexus flocculans]|nr:hypothetical protein [Candidatus Moduliflexus flocculans]
MGMGVDESGEDGSVAEIDNDGILGNGGILAKRGDLVPLDDDVDMASHLRTLTIDESSGFDDIGLIRRSDDGQKKETS